MSVDRASGRGLVVTAGFDAPFRVWPIESGRSPCVVRPGIRDSGHTDFEPARAVIAELTVSQVTYPSLDGTEIGMFLIHRADVEPGPDTPTILNGYGGFAIAETPVWSPTIAAWCERGGLYAIAGLRGGIEHGEAWHHAGRREPTSRTCSTTSTPPPTGWSTTGRHVAERLADRRAVRTAGCSSVPR